ncbi:MAG: molybdenum cofactor guanylyltransferase [Lachnospiraceae bacterium]|jgi:molybdopterin-guanine dinucleotide biosynthesis protein A|nr:molybdenum cofactor guanylyltransferase [Lachnospiraceae bacterium]
MRDGAETAMVLLMGGKSSRMGTSKAYLTWEGEPFWQRIAREMAGCGPLYLSVAADFADPELSSSYRLIRDEVEAAGPMGGLLSVMGSLSEDAFFICACDMPLMSRGYIRRLLRLWQERQGEWDGLMVKSAGGRIYTTAGIYHRRLLPAVRERIAVGNYRMMALLRDSRIWYLPEEELGEDQKALTNLNTMEEYRAIHGMV